MGSGRAGGCGWGADTSKARMIWFATSSGRQVLSGARRPAVRPQASTTSHSLWRVRVGIAAGSRPLWATLRARRTTARCGARARSRNESRPRPGTPHLSVCGARAHLSPARPRTSRAVAKLSWLSPHTPDSRSSPQHGPGCRALRGHNGPAINGGRGTPESPDHQPACTAAARCAPECRSDDKATRVGGRSGDAGGGGNRDGGSEVGQHCSLESLATRPPCGAWARAGAFRSSNICADNLLPLCISIVPPAALLQRRPLSHDVCHTSLW
eukprot:SAG11_NODE_6311_length_1340_cov_1.703465_2_plen_269_part_00